LFSIQQIFLIGGIGRLESTYNFRLAWRLLDTVCSSLKEYTFVPGKFDDLIRREFSLAGYYNAELVLLETSGHFGACTNNKETIDHIKAAYRIIAMLHSITLDLVSAKLYFLNRVNSATVPTNHKECKTSFGLKPIIVAESVDVLKLLETSHDKNKNTLGATKLEPFLGETAEVKLPGGQLAEIDDIFLASSPIRPSSDRSTSSSENL
ncbi:hypothetical protein EDC94DRAFT_510114, partial [Helicostylum pulchrum]